jgi:hypothetical protein
MTDGMMSPEAMHIEGMNGPLGVPGADGELGVADPNVFNIFGSLSPYHGRYLDVNFEPLSAQLVRSILTAQELPSEHLELIVAKRVPVRIALRMDERKIPDFMTAAANSPFAFEINQIRLNRHISGEGIEFNGGGNGAGNAATVASGALAGAGAGSGMEKGYGAPGSGMMDRPGMGGSGMARPGMGGPGMGIPMGQNSFGEMGQENLVLKPSPVETRTNYDVDVEFYGIIKIYNPVREKFLRTAAGQQVDEQPAETPDPNQAAKSQPAIDKRQTSPQDLRKS